jgi:hypothetical protein
MIFGQIWDGLGDLMRCGFSSWDKSVLNLLSKMKMRNENEKCGAI